MSVKDFAFGFTISGTLQNSFTSSFAKAQDKIKNLDKAMRANKDMLEAMDKAYKSSTISQKSYTDGVAQLNKQMAKLSAKKDIALGYAKMNNQLSKAGEHMMTATKWAGAMGLAFGVPIAEATKFESAMADVRKVVDFDTPQQFKQMGKDILEMSTKMPMAAEGIAQIVAAGGQAGIAKKDLEAFAESAVKMSIAFDTSAEDAGQKMANWRTAFQMNQSEVVDLADKINYLGNNTAASAMTISDIVTRIGPLGKVAGVASGEIAAMGASIAGTGIPAEIAATGFKNMVLTLNAGESATKAQATAFAKLGINATDLAKKMQTDARGGILEVLEALKKLPKAEQAATLTKLFGRESVQAIAPLLANLDNLKHNFDLVADKEKYAGSMDKEYAARCNTTANQMSLLKNQVTALAINIGSALLPAVNGLLAPMASVAGALSKWAGEHPGLITSVVALTAGIGGLMIAVNICGAVFSTAKAIWVGAVTTFKLMRFAIATTSAVMNLATVKTVALSVAQRAGALVTGLMTAAQWAFNVALNANPIGVVIMLIAGLIAIGYELYQHWSTISEFLTSMWDSPIVKIGLFISGPIGWLIAAGLSLIANWDAVKQWFTLLWNDPTAAVQQFCNTATNLLGSLFDWAGNKWNALKNIFEQPITVTIKKFFGGGGDDKPKNKNAKGGIYNKGYFVTSFAEDSGESAIPHTPNARNIGLLAQTNAIMGNPLGVGKQGGGSISLNYAPVINLSGGEPGSTEKFETALKQQLSELKRMLEELENQRRRVTYA